MSSANAERNDRVVDQLYAAIRALPPAKRALVVLYLDGFSYREIADVVGISESNVGDSVNRIKKEFAVTIQQNDNEMSGSTTASVAGTASRDARSHSRPSAH